MAVSFAWLLACIVTVMLPGGTQSVGMDHRLFFSLSPDCVTPPQVCPNENVTFYLYTRNRANSPHRLNVLDSASILLAPFIQNQPIKFLIHGYENGKDGAPNKELRPAFFSRFDYNIISIDYEPLVRVPCYPWAVANLPLVSQCSAQLIDYIVAYTNISLNRFHVIGFSLGAQVAGQIPNYLHAGLLDRITGMDPAKPLVVGTSRNKLDAGDAHFVDVMHTNGGQRGKKEIIGHQDVYVNDAVTQPGCESWNPDSASSCSHNRAPFLYAESIVTDVGFWSLPCPSRWWIFPQLCWPRPGQVYATLMGEFTNQKATGVYYVQTNRESPYAQGYIHRAAEPSHPGWLVSHRSGWPWVLYPNSLEDIYDGL